MLLLRWSRRAGWTSRHVLAAATGALLDTGVVAFTVTPLGHVSRTAQHATNAVLLAVVIGLTTLAAVRARRAERHLA